MRGVDTRHEYSREELIRHTRPLGKKVAEALSNPLWACMGLILAGMMVFAVPQIAATGDIFLIIGPGYFYWFWKKGESQRLPLRMPTHANQLDPGDLHPGTKKPQKSSGIAYVGNDKQTGEEIWVKNEDLRAHFFYPATTGSGKSEGLKSLSVNAFCWASGLAYMDGKAQNTLWADFWALARRFGRDDDVRILNYFPNSLSNTLNPFSFDSAANLGELIISLMSDAGSDPIWKELAITLVKALIPVLVWMRDNQGLMLNTGVIRRSTELEEVIKLSRRQDIPEELRVPLKSYLKEVAGYQEEYFDDEGKPVPPAPGQKEVNLETIREQHGYRTMQLGRPLGSLNDDYGYIFRANLADIDMRDIVLQRRVLIVLIPGLGKSADELANLGKIVIANLRGMMAGCLGTEVEGEWSEVIENSPTTSPSPYGIVFDEAGAYMAPGMGMIFAQGRSLGFWCTLSSQDLPGLRKRVAEEADQCIGNCNTQLWGSIVEATETKKLFEETVGKVFVTQSAGFSGKIGIVTANYNDRMDASIEHVERADWLDLKGQVEGEVHITFKDRLIRATLFYAAPKKTKSFRVGRFLQVASVTGTEEEITAAKETREFLEMYRKEDWAAATCAPKAETSPGLLSVVRIFGKGVKAGLSALECGSAAVASLEAQLDDKAARLQATFDAAHASSPASSGAGSATHVAPANVPAAAAVPSMADDDDKVDADHVLAAAAAASQAAQTVQSVERDLGAWAAKRIVEKLCAKVPVEDVRAGGGDAVPVLAPQIDQSAAVDEVAVNPFEDETILQVDEVRDLIEDIEVAAGADQVEAKAASAEIMKEIEPVAHYPEPPIPERPPVEDVLDIISSIKSQLDSYKVSKR